MTCVLGHTADGITLCNMGSAMPDNALQRLAIETAVQVARGAGDYSDLLDGFVRRLGADAGASLVRWTFRGEDVGATMQVSGCPPPSSSLLAQANREDLLHPGLARLADLSTVRLSDVTDLKKFWGTSSYEKLHGWCRGRYALGAQLFRDRHQITLLALHRAHTDFTEAQTDQVEAARRPLAAALAFRLELDRALATLPTQSQHLRQHLTPRQLEIMALTAKGWTSRRIGRTLGITERTVRKHLGDIYERAQVSGRTEAVAWWQRSHGSPPDWSWTVATPTPLELGEEALRPPIGG